MARQIRPTQRYGDRLLKLIPSEIVAAYVAVQGMIPEDADPWFLLVVTVLMTIMTPFYLKRFQRVIDASQLAVSTGSFLVWVYTLGGPFRFWGLYRSWSASVLLVIWTLAVPLLMSGGEEASAVTG